MSLPVSSEFLLQLKTLLELSKSKPSIINHPDLEFFKNFVENLGGKVPKQEKNDEDTSESFDKETKSEPQEPESEESDLELDMTAVIEPDNDAPQPMGDYDLQPTEEQIAESHEQRLVAVSAFVEKDYEKSIKYYTEAILLNPQSSLFYAKRGQVYLLLNKPNACIRDCDRGLELNPDSAAAYKFRGRANQLLGKWEEAANDLRKACKFDFDEQADEWLREVTPNALKIEEHKRKRERKVLERQEREKLDRLKKVREAQAKAREESAKQQAQTEPEGPASGPGGPGNAQFAQFLNDPELLVAFQDPEVAEALKDISSNPSNILKYQSNPKVMTLINKVASKFSDAGGGAGAGAGGLGGLGNLAGMMGGLGGMAGMAGMAGMGGFGPGGEPPKPSETGPDDFGLD